MATRTFCDRCGKELSSPEEVFVEDNHYYSGQDICNECSLDIEIVKSAAQAAAIKGISVGQALRQWLKIYQDDESK